MKTKYFILIYLFSSLQSCSDNKLPRIGFFANSCVQEDSEKYRHIASIGTTIYKLEKIEHKGLTVSVWSQNEWYYQGVKPLTFFKNSKAFTYKETKCPDNKGRDTSLSARLKKISN